MRFFLCLVVATASVAAVHGADPSRPNIVWLFIDSNQSQGPFGKNRHSGKKQPTTAVANPNRRQCTTPTWPCILAASRGRPVRRFLRRTSLL